jgi:hypothetical protein
VLAQLQGQRDQLGIFTGHNLRPHGTLSHAIQRPTFERYQKYQCGNKVRP